MVEGNRAAVREWLGHSQRAKSASEILKELPGSLVPTRKDLSILLDDMVAAGEIFIWPGKRYWDRNPQAEVQRLILRLLPNSGALSAAKMKTVLRLPSQVIHQSLQVLVGEGRVHLWQPGKTVQYCLAEPGSGAREIILTALADGPLTEKELVRRVRQKLAGYKAKNLKQHLSPLLQSGQVIEHPKYGKTPAGYGLKPPNPNLYLDRAKSEIETVHKLLAPSGITIEEIYRALGEHLGVVTGPPAGPRKKPEDTISLAEAERLVLEGISRLQPLGQSRALVSIRELRRSLTLPKSEFDRAVFSLSMKSRVALHHHDFPSSLSPAEREEMVRDDRGTYYVGIVPLEAS